MDGCSIDERPQNDDTRISQPKGSRNMAGYINVEAALAEAKKLLAAKTKVMEEIDIVRTDLRNAVKRKEANAEQAKWIGEQFPLQERKRRKTNNAESQTVA